MKLPCKELEVSRIFGLSASFQVLENNAVKSSRMKFFKIINEPEDLMFTLSQEVSREYISLENTRK
jgi:hypothetical protein